MIHSFLLIGQSNMAGRGFLNEAVEIDSSRIKLLKNGRWQPFFRPINPDRGFSGVNLAESFAEKYSQKYNVDTGLICCADGGTSLMQWKPGGLLYDNAVNNARLAERTSTIAGVLWHQGEADCSLQYYPTYAKRLTELFNALRKDLNLYDVPILIGGLGDFLKDRESSPDLKNYPYINNALKEVAQNNDMIGFVSARGYASNGDNLHFNAKSLHNFGLRYFDEFEKLRKSDKVFAEKPCEDDALRTDMELL